MVYSGFRKKEDNKPINLNIFDNKKFFILKQLNEKSEFLKYFLLHLTINFGK